MATKHFRCTTRHYLRANERSARTYLWALVAEAELSEPAIPVVLFFSALH
jgi:hypothetical protein